MTDKEALNRAFNELEYEEEAFNELEKQLQRKVATGVTDGTKNPDNVILELRNKIAEYEALIRDLTDALRAKDDNHGA